MGTEFSFKNLGLFRKIYVIFMWCALGFIFIYQAIEPNGAIYFHGSAFVLMPLFLIWVTYAIVKRKIYQLLAFAALHCFPGFSGLVAIILFCIFIATKREIRTLECRATGNN